LGTSGTISIGVTGYRCVGEKGAWERGSMGAWEKILCHSGHGMDVIRNPLWLSLRGRGTCRSNLGSCKSVIFYRRVRGGTQRKSNSGKIHHSEPRLGIQSFCHCEESPTLRDDAAIPVPLRLAFFNTKYTKLLRGKPENLLVHRSWSEGVSEGGSLMRRRKVEALTSRSISPINKTSRHGRLCL
jgi:hypothetical protein